MNMYIVSPFAQEEEVTKYCFHECGKVRSGAVEICGGQFFVCFENRCQYCEKAMIVIDESTKILNEIYDRVIARKLCSTNGAVKMRENK